MVSYNPTQIIVDKSQLETNIFNIRKWVDSSVKILIAVKGNGYGHGSIEVSRIAEKNGVGWLAVATTQEGIKLRSAGIKLPILKFSPVFDEEMNIAIDNDITFTVSSYENIKILEEKSRIKRKISNVHLAIDTGMGRIGATAENSPELADFIDRECRFLYLEGLFSHLSMSEDLNSEFSRIQNNIFKDTTDAIQNRINRRVKILHMANSGGTLYHPDTWYDMVRPGLIVYGYYPDSENVHPISIKPALSLVSKLSFIRKINRGTTIGYGNTWKAQTDTWIGTFPAGYADGLDRRFSNKGAVLINGQLCPIVGRVCMDQTMVNLGETLNAKIGDQVVLIGKSENQVITCDDWSNTLETLPNEILTRIGHRSEIYYV